MVEETCAITCRVAPSFVRVGHVDHFARRAGGRGAAPADEFLCAITREVMDDPVLAADGFSYERDAIERWFRTRATSPTTNERVPPTLVPNGARRDRVRRHFNM